MADEQALFTDALRKLLEPEFDVIGAVGNGRSLLQQAPTLHPDVVLLGILMPLLNGIESGRRLKRLLPNIKIIVLTAWENPALAAEVTSTWASGYLLKKITGTELILAIHCVLNGEKYMSACLQKKLNHSFPTGSIPDSTKRLTVRQREVLQTLAEGKTLKEAGSILALSPRTICYHKYKMMKSLGISTNADLLRVAIKERLLFLQ